MIKRLSYKSHFQLMAMLLEEKEINDGIIGCINYNGYNSVRCRIYGDFDEILRLKGMFIINNNQCMIYYRDKITEDVVNKLRGIKEVKSILGKRSSVECVQDILGAYDIWDTTLSVLKENKLKDFEEKDFHRVTEKDAAELYKYYCSIFKEKIRFTEENVRDMYKNEYAIAYCIKENKKIISSAEFYNSMTSYMNIMGVGTIKKHRRKGYAQKCVSKVCTEILKLGKIPILRWETEEAGEMYRKLGFKNIGCYRVCQKKEQVDLF